MFQVMIDEDEIENEDDEKNEAPQEIPVPEASEALDAEIVEVAQQIIDLEHDKKLLQKRINAQYEILELQGIPKGAMKTSINELKYTQQQRDNYDKSLTIVRSALGIPIQMDMFK